MDRLELMTSGINHNKSGKYRQSTKKNMATFLQDIPANDLSIPHIDGFYTKSWSKPLQ
jgi:hypothetical protein